MNFHHHLATCSLHMFLSLFGYIDPSSGSYFYQLAIAGLTTIVFFFSNIKRRVLGVFKRKKEPYAPDLAAAQSKVEKSTLAE